MVVLSQFSEEKGSQGVKEVCFTLFYYPLRPAVSKCMGTGTPKRSLVVESSRQAIINWYLINGSRPMTEFSAMCQCSMYEMVPPACEPGRVIIPHMAADHDVCSSTGS